MNERVTKKKPKITGIILIVLIIVAAGAIAFTFIGTDDAQGGMAGGPGAGGPGEGGPGAGGPGQSEVEVTYSVLVETMEPSVMENYLKFNGDVIAETSVDIYPDTAGKLTKLSVALGDYIRKGQVIAEVDPSLPGQVYVASPVTSTISGTVTDLPNKVGATISTTQVPLATVGNLEALQLDSFISEKDMASIKLGQQAEISFEPFESEIFTGSVIEISPVLDRDSRTLEIKISLENRESKVKSGMFGSIRLITETKEDVLSIPSESLIEGNDGYFVYIVSEENTARQTYVETGLELDGRVEVTGGLSEGDRVVTRGQSMIQDGSAVKIAE